MSLQSLITKSPLEIMEEARQRYNIKEEVGLFSGGKDSLVTCIVSGVKKIIYLKTGIGLKENEEYVKMICEKFGWERIVLEPLPERSYEDFVRRFRFPHQGQHNSIMAFLKWYPLRKYAKEHKDEGLAFISGRRKKESKRRMRMKSLKYIDKPEKNMLFVSPLYYWSDFQVFDYINERKIPLCPVYKTMHMSGDCLCGSFSVRGEAQLLNVFHKETADYIKSLEDKYGDKWGNDISMKEVKKLGKLDDFVCNDCIIDAYSTVEKEGFTK